jgi:cytochrome c553
MKHVHLVLAILAAGLVAGCANPSRSRDLANPKVPAQVLAQQVCSNCHGVAGTSVSPNFPNLAAQTPAYIVGQLKEFKSHGREDPAGFEYMWGISRSLTDEQIDGLAASFSSQTPSHRPAEADPNLAAAGKAIFTGGLPAKNVPACMSCHGNAGQGNDAFPRLASQHVDYIVKQLIVFQRTDERPKGAMMKAIVHDLSPEDIRNVAAYLQTLG